MWGRSELRGISDQKGTGSLNDDDPVGHGWRTLKLETWRPPPPPNILECISDVSNIPTGFGPIRAAVLVVLLEVPAVQLPTLRFQGGLGGRMEKKEMIGQDGRSMRSVIRSLLRVMRFG